jgi:hypothetical protein
MLDHLGDPQVLTAEGSTLYWIDADKRSLHAWSEADAGAPRVITDFVAPIADLVQPFTVSGRAIHLLTLIDGERQPRVERMSTAGGSRVVLSNAIPAVLGVGFDEGRVFVVVDAEPPKRSMVGEVFEIGADRKLTSLGSTNGTPRAIATAHGVLFAAAAAGVSRHGPRAKDPASSHPDFCGPAIAVADDRVYFARTSKPVVASYYNDERVVREVPLTAFAVALRAHGSGVYVGTRDTDPLPGADRADDRDSVMRTVARSLHEADESVRQRRHIRALLRIDGSDGKVTRLATFAPPVTSFAVTGRGVYVASPDHGGSIYRLPL